MDRLSLLLVLALIFALLLLLLLDIASDPEGETGVAKKEQSLGSVVILFLIRGDIT
jgi:hypothetical protein